MEEVLATYIKALIALFVITDPIGNAPIFLGLTEKYGKKEKAGIARMASFTTVAILVGSVLAGEHILGFFGIRLPSFQVAGGILLLLNAIAMLMAKHSPTRHSQEMETEAAGKENIAIVPLAIPLSAGPGSISTAILYGHEFQGFIEKGFLILCCALVGFSLYLAFRFAGLMAQKISKTGLDIATRLSGIILAALGVEFIARGLLALLPGLAG